MKSSLLRVFGSLLLTLILETTWAQPTDILYSPVIPTTAGLSMPIEVVTAPGESPNRLYIVEQAGVIRIWENGALLTPAFLDMRSRVNFDGNERGLLSMAFHPNYASNGYFFVYYNDLSGNITVSRFQVSTDPDIANSSPNPASPLFSVSKPFTNHNGGHLQFKPQGGINYMYFATGDGGSGNDPNNFAQTYTSRLGKMIRMNVDAPTPTPEIWAWGLRNPFRWSFDRTTGDMWIGDVGQGSREELNFRAGGTIGANYGWVCFEGTQTNGSAPSSANCDTVGDVDIQPVYDYINPSLGRSIIGGYVYRGTEFPTMQGYYFFTDFYSDRLWMVTPNGSSWNISSKTGMATNIASISEGNDGSLYAVRLTSGEIFKLVIPTVTPLRLTGFTGKSFITYNEINWITESEETMSKYIVEYSTDARNFSAFGEIAARNNNRQNNYSLRHQFNSTIAQTYYYRLRMEEINGSYSYSPVIMVGDGRYTGIKVYPTVVQNGTINIISGLPVEQVNITGMDGQTVFAKQMNGVDGYFSIVVPSMQKGFYLVQIITNGRRQTEKILVQ